MGLFINLFNSSNKAILEKIIKKYKSFEEAEKAEIEFWRNASYEERINTMLYVQELMLELYYPGVKRIERVVSFRKFGEE